MKNINNCVKMSQIKNFKINGKCFIINLKELVSAHSTDGHKIICTFGPTIKNNNECIKVEYTFSDQNEVKEFMGNLT